MRAVLLFLLLAAAAALLLGGKVRLPRPRTAAGASSSGAGIRMALRGRQTGGAEGRLVMVRIVRQLAALQTAGRSGPLMWQDLAATLTAEHGSGAEHGHTAGTAVAGGPGTGKRGNPVELQLAVIVAVQQAALMGLPASEAIREAIRAACRSAGPATRGFFPAMAVWTDLAACLDVSEASGAPLAAVLTRFAAKLEDDLDAAAQRETALAGPRATVQLLGWLPALGLVLGMAMGVDPLGVLLGGPVGWMALAAGVGLSLAGRWWSGRLIAGAARERRPA